jgi:hypothetical protein
VKRFLALLGATGLAFGLALFPALPAGAAVTGGCSGSALLDGATIDAIVTTEAAGRVTIPREANVQYRGSVPLSEGGEELPYDGEVVLDLAPPFSWFAGGDPTVSSWSWGGSTTSTATEGSTSYDLDLPADLLGGVKATASGHHNQGPVQCVGSVDLEIEGSAVNAASLAAGALTVLSGAGLGFAALGRP